MAVGSRVSVGVAIGVSVVVGRVIGVDGVTVAEEVVGVEVEAGGVMNLGIPQKANPMSARAMNPPIIQMGNLERGDDTGLESG